MKKSELIKVIKEEILKERKYEANSEKSGVVDIIYDTLMGNTQYPQFKLSNVKDPWVNSAEGSITFKYKLDEIFTDKESITKIKPKWFTVTIDVDVQ